MGMLSLCPLLLSVYGWIALPHLTASVAVVLGGAFLISGSQTYLGHSIGCLRPTPLLLEAVFGKTLLQDMCPITSTQASVLERLRRRVRGYGPRQAFLIAEKLLESF